MATTNLGKVSVTPKGEYDPLITYERLDVISHNGSSYIVKQASTGVTPIEGEFYALIAEKGDGGSFVKKAYKTYAAMDADKVNIPANSSVDVTNDPDESKNGAYIYDGVAFTRSQYDSKVVTDKIIADTASAVQDAINNTVVSSGFVTIDSFELGATLTQRNQALRHAEDGTLYRWAGDLPKVVPASSTPASSGGMGDNAWLEVSDVTLRQDLANPDKGAAMVGRGVVAVDSIADLLTLPAGQRKADIRYLVKEYHAGTGFGGGDFVWDATSTATTNNGTVFAVTGVVTGRWLRVLDGGDWWVEWFGPKKDGVTDDSDVIRTAVAAAPAGGTLRFGVGDFLVLSSVRVAKLLNLYGSGMGTKMLIQDTMFILGQHSSGGTRFNAQPIIKDFCFTSPSGGEQGNIGTYYGDARPSVGYLTRTTPAAGFKKSSTENATNTAIVFEQIYAPCKISGCFFHRIGTGIKVGLNYGHIIENNRFLWCTVGVDIGGNTTTVNLVTNTIERCAIGVHIHYPCHHVFVDKNIIEANYGGCDILCFQGPQSLTITRNYMEASPDCIVFSGDSPSYPASKVLIEGNYSIRLKFRGMAKNFKVIRNNLTHVDFDLKVGDILSNIVFEDNYRGNHETPFDPIYSMNADGLGWQGVRWNSVSERFKETIKFISATRFIAPAHLDHTTDHMSTFIKTEANLIHNASSVLSLAFDVVAPNEDFIANLEVTSIKSLVDGTKSSRIVKHTVMIRRIKDQDTVATVTLDSDVDIPSADGLTISEANPTPTTPITGASTEKQTVSVNIMNRDAYLEPANWIVGVEMLCNRTDVLIIRRS